MKAELLTRVTLAFQDTGAGPVPTGASFASFGEYLSALARAAPVGRLCPCGRRRRINARAVKRCACGRRGYRIST